MQRSKYSPRSTLLAALAMAATLPGIAEPAVTLRSAGGGNNRRPTPPKRDTALQREIADHNEAIEARKAEKRARRLRAPQAPTHPGQAPTGGAE